MGKSRDILSRPFIRGPRSRDGGVIASECRVQLATRHPHSTPAAGRRGGGGRPTGNPPPQPHPTPPPPPGWSPQPGHTRTTPPTQNRPRYVPPVRRPLTPSSRPRTMNSQTNSAPTTSPSSATTPSAGSSAKVTPCYPPPRADTHRHLWLRPSRHPQAHRHPRCRQKGPQVIHPPSHPRAPPPPPPPPPPHRPSPRDHRHRVPYMARHGALQRRRAV